MSTRKTPRSGKRQNIQVAVRVRPLNANEIADRSRNIVGLDRVARSVSLKDRASSRVYAPFDKVYGEKDSQAVIYSDLIAPLVSEVLTGYNCTVFVYGQTGTGKTYTMEGHHDESGEYSWQNDPTCGVIPRALHHIFTELEKQELEEYSVRVSYLELYNEELYDLLGASDIQSTRLRIFEDPMKKGSVVINGMEEVPVKNRDEVYRLLRRGAERRKTAATLMNMNSSRSHSVFTVTVVIRENSVNGEELLKQGKLHLVDLAGSENVGKSGAVDKRAREAGNINQSLLTLGRVITSLTSNAQHIPYRESKLTRILQDSLGGRTITTLIATLSPAQSNFEESVNTLEYALRAKNIKNHPEVNEKLSRRALLKEYNEEIERLRKDLMAAREQNGVYLATENYEDMVEQIQKQTERIEKIEGELEGVIAKLQRAMADIEMMDAHYQKVYERNQAMHTKLEKRRSEVEQLSRDLATTKHTLEATEFALGESQAYGEKARNQNVELGETCTILSTQLEKTHDKIDQLKGIFVTNDKLYGDFAAERIHKIHDLDNVLQKCRATVQDVSNTTTSVVDTTGTSIGDFCTSIRTLFAETVSRTEHFASEVSEALSTQCSEGVSTAKIHSDSVEGSLSEMKKLNAVAFSQLESLLALTTRAFEKVEANKQQFLENSECERVVAEKQRRTFADQMRSMLEQQTKLFNESLQLAAKMEELTGENDVEVKKGLEETRKIGETFAKAVDETKEEALLECQLETEKGRQAVKSVDELNSALSVANKKAFMDSERLHTENLKGNLTSIEELKKSVVANCSNSLAEEVATTVTQAVDLVKSNAESQAASVETAVGDAAVRLGEAQLAIETFVHEKVQRPQSSGATPERTRFPPASEIPALDTSDALKEAFYASRQQFKRKSIRTRESLFENEIPLMSPVSLQRMLGSLEEEKDENVDDELINDCETISARAVERETPEKELDARAVRRNRRRAFGSNNFDV
uniref:Kinesin-like protein n=1 Tax=Steinernema glaseri TaxID=37863 RepID=A0A1I7Z7K2_9BILA